MKVLRKEFIGLDIIITSSKNKTLVGLKGKIINETKNTFEIKTTKETKMIMKNISTFEINKETIQGKKITKKPQDRIKIK